MASGEVTVINVTKKTVLAARAAVADTPRSRRRGLLGTEALEDGRGLVIVPCRQIHTFGMRYAIDVVFVDRRMRVLRVAKAMRPRRLGALALRAAAAIELPPGKAAATGTASGDMLEIIAYCPCDAEGARVEV